MSYILMRRRPMASLVLKWSRSGLKALVKTEPRNLKALNVDESSSDHKDWVNYQRWLGRRAEESVLNGTDPKNIRHPPNLIVLDDQLVVSLIRLNFYIVITLMSDNGSPSHSRVSLSRSNISPPDCPWLRHIINIGFSPRSKKRNSCRTGRSY